MTMDDRRKLIAEARVKAAWSRHSKTIHDLTSALSDTLDQVERLREVVRAVGDWDEYQRAYSNLQPGDV